MKFQILTISAPYQNKFFLKCMLSQKTITITGQNEYKFIVEIL